MICEIYKAIIFQNLVEKLTVSEFLSNKIIGSPPATLLKKKKKTKSVFL